MPIQHINRQGDTYFLHQGITKTGKPKYHFSKKSDGTLATEIPAGYEIYENPNSQVYLRVIVPPLVTKAEIETVETGVRDLAELRTYIVDVKGKDIVVHTPNQDGERLADIISPFLSLAGRENAITKLETSGGYHPMLRFTLGDGDTDLDIYVYDNAGRLIVSGIGYTDREVVRFVPPYSGNYRIVVRNLGNVYNDFSIGVR